MTDRDQSTAAGDELAREVWALMVRVTIAHHEERFARVTASVDVSMPQAHALLELDPNRPVSMTVLAQCLGNDPSNITGLVDRLERKGLVERRSHPGDRRVKSLVLTDAGRQIRADLREQLADPPQALLKVRPGTLRTLRSTLEQLVASGQSGPGDRGS